MNRLSILLSSLALVVALTAGGAYAATSTVLNGNTIQNHTISLAKLTPKAVKQLKGKRGPRGLDGFDGADGADGVDGMTTTATGAPGATGATGAAGGFDLSKIAYVSGLQTTIVPGTADTELVATCPLGSKVISGGWFADHGSTYLSSSTIDGRSWLVWIDANGESEYGTGWAYAVCAAG